MLVPQTAIVSADNRALEPSPLRLFHDQRCALDPSVPNPLRILRFVWHMRPGSSPYAPSCGTPEFTAVPPVGLPRVSRLTPTFDFPNTWHHTEVRSRKFPMRCAPPPPHAVEVCLLLERPELFAVFVCGARGLVRPLNLGRTSSRSILSKTFTRLLSRLVTNPQWNRCALG